MAKKKGTHAVNSLMRAADMSATERQALLDTVHSSISKEYGENSILSLGDPARADKSPFLISTGSLALDIIIGPLRRLDSGRWIHGIPPGTILEAFGREGCGKSTLAGQTLARLQSQYKRLGLRAAYIDPENAVDKDYFALLGVDVDNMDYIQPNSGEEALDIMDSLIKSGMYGIIVMDSVAALVPMKELEGAPTDTRMGLQAAMMSTAMRHINNSLSHSPTVLFFVNQIRSSMGYGDTTPGGNALPFYCKLRLALKKGELIFKSGMTTDPVGHRIIAFTRKNKISPPAKTADFALYYGHGVDPVVELIELGVKYGVVALSGSWYSHPCGLKAQGVPKAAIAMREHQMTWCRQIKDELLTLIMAQRGMNPDGTYIEGFVGESTQPIVKLDFNEDDYVESESNGK